MAPRRLLSYVALLVVALAAPAASAAPIQVGLTATDVGELEVGQSESVNVEVTASSNDNIVCPQQGTITVTLEAQRADDSLGLIADVSPASVDFTIAAGAYTAQTGAWAPDAQAVTFTVTLDAAKVPVGHAAHEFNLHAVFDGGAPGTCQAAAWAEASADAPISVTPVFPETPAGPTGPTAPTGEEPTSEGGGGDGKDSPSVGFVAGLLAVAFVALRRRHL